ncbi:MAG: YitT family protein [Synergistaceae bacterium]|nr:YitT family protein [Synergistaceae bacterium]
MTSNISPADELKLKHLWKKARLLWLTEWKTLLFSLIAIVVYAVGVVGFTIPYEFADQGLMGIAVLFKYTIGLNPAYVTLAINCVLLVWGARTLSKRFFIWSVINVFLLSLVLELLQRVQFPMMSDIFLVAVTGGVIKGLGSGLLFREGVSAGGLDVVLAVLRKRYGMEVGRLSFYFNMAILAVSFGIIGLEKVMYGFISCYICGMSMDGVLASFDKRRLVFVITSHTEAVVDFISKKLGRGCTLLASEGGYKRRDGFTIMCLLMPRQTMELKRFLAEKFPGSFMVVTEANEVVGRGFKRWRNI